MISFSVLTSRCFRTLFVYLCLRLLSPPRDCVTLTDNGSWRRRWPQASNIHITPASALMKHQTDVFITVAHALPRPERWRWLWAMMHMPGVPVSLYAHMIRVTASCLSHAEWCERWQLLNVCVCVKLYTLFNLVFWGSYPSVASTVDDLHCTLVSCSRVTEGDNLCRQLCMGWMLKDHEASSFLLPLWGGISDLYHLITVLQFIEMHFSESCPWADSAPRDTNEMECRPVN